MLTRRGWGLAASSALSLAAGRLFGILELFLLAVGALGLALLGVTYVRLARFNLATTRELRPPRVHAGTASRVELTVRNTSPRRSPVLAARDPFDNGRRWARFLLAPLDPGEVARAAYRLPTDKRGVYDLGPLELELTDPFGLAAVRVAGAPATKLTVYPHVDPIAPPPLTRGNDPLAGADHPTALSGAGEDFYALREYEVGDDLRRVHWKSTAKLGELMIRQDEMPWQGRATVVLDLRTGIHTAASLEIAVSAAASIVSACWKRRSLVRLVSTDGVDSGFGSGSTHVDAILEHLAEAQMERGHHLAPMLSGLQRKGATGALLVVTTASCSTDDLSRIARLQTRFGAVTLVLVERSAADVSAAGRAAPPRPVLGVASVVRVSADQPFAAAWETTWMSEAALR